MNLIIDQGNTSIKVAVFNKDEIVSIEKCAQLDSVRIAEILSRFQIDAAILSSVGDRSLIDLQCLRNLVPKVLVLDSSVPLPIGNVYDTPATLGADRLAVCVGANSIKRDTSLLVIDMGTCITYDFVNRDNQFVGGNIAPGLSMRLKALNHYTAALPLVEPADSVPLIGTNTHDAILAGVVQGIVYEVEGHRRNLEDLYPDLSVFLTGGNAFYFERRLKSGIFAVQNLLLIGLNRILDFVDV